VNGYHSLLSAGFKRRTKWCIRQVT
jgi:hypothetical protein